MIIYFLIGSIGGLLSGLLGIGGGAIIVPLLTYLTKSDFKTNTGISSLAVVLIATGSSITYIFNDYSNGSNFIYEILIIVIGGIVGSYLGSKLTAKLSTPLLKKIFSLLLAASAFRIIFSSTVSSGFENNVILYFIVGFVSGVGSGLLGIGGGIIRIPMLIFFGGFEQIIAQGISLIATIPSALTAAITKIRNDRQLIKIGLIVGVFGILGSIIGGNLTLNIIPREILNISFGIFLIFVSINMFVSNK